MNENTQISNVSSLATNLISFKSYKMKCHEINHTYIHIYLFLIFFLFHSKTPQIPKTVTLLLV